MSSSKFRSILLVAFAVLTIVFSSISAYEFVQVQQLKSSTMTTSTTTVTSTPSTTYTSTYTSTFNYTSTYVTTETRITTSTITVTSPVPKLPDEGEFEIVNKGTFAYKYVGDLQEGASVTFKNVTFDSVGYPGTITGCVIRVIWVSLPGGTGEKLSVGWCYPSEISIEFTNHSFMKAGVIFAPRDYQLGETIVSSSLNAGVYVLVGI